MRFLAFAAATLALVLPPSAGGGGQLTALRAHVESRPASIRIVVEFAGDLELFQVTALDGRIRDALARVEIVQSGISTQALPVVAYGVGARFVLRRSDQLVAHIHTGQGRFKYLSYRVRSVPERLVIDLWKARAASRASAVRNDGCLRITSYRGGPGVEMSGRELVPLFEHTVVVRLRDARGKLLAQRPLIASNRRWGTSFTYSVSRRQRATLEAVAESAKDGSLECIVQVPVTLRE